MTCCNPFSIDTLPPELAALNGGELDGRYIDCAADLGAVGDLIPSIATVSIVIARSDGFPVGPTDLQLATSMGWPLALDPTRLVVTVGLYAPYESGGESYVLSLLVNRTQMGRLYVRSFDIDVIPGIQTTPVVTSGSVATHDYTKPSDAWVYVISL